MKKTGVIAIGLSTVMGLLLAPHAMAVAISTQFNTSDGFVTGDFNPVTLTNGGLSVTFAGGQQLQGFDLPSYNTNPAGYLFINGPFTGSFGSTVSGDGGAVDGINDDLGLIDFNTGVATVSFFAANRANGGGVTLNVFGVDDTTLLGTVFITQTSNQSSDGASLTTITSAAFGGSIGSIGIDLPGPAGNPPYVLAIDNFSVRTAIPEPVTASLSLMGLGVLSIAARRRAA